MLGLGWDRQTEFIIIIKLSYGKKLRVAREMWVVVRHGRNPLKMGLPNVEPLSPLIYISQ